MFRLNGGETPLLLEVKSLSIIFQHLVRDSFGILPITSDPVPASPKGSQGLLINDDGEVYVAFTTTLSTFLVASPPMTRDAGGLPIDANGALILSSNAVSFYDQGLAFAADGGLVVSFILAADFYNQGIAYKASGAVIIAGGPPPENPPDQVTGLVVTTPTLEALTLNWSTPASLDAPINGYVVQYRFTGATPWIQNSIGVMNSYEIAGLVTGQSYDTRVAASNVYGTGPFSAIVTGTPENVPVAPANLVLTPSVDAINAAWDAVTSFPAVTSYTIEYKESSSGTWIVVNNGLSLTIDLLGLTSGTQYDVRVKATNSRGDSPYTPVQQAVPSGVPAQITNLLAIVGIESAPLTWTTPVSSPALTAINIEYKLSSTGTWINFARTGTASGQTIYNLYQAQSYDFRVRGVNANGNGPWSNIASTTPTLIAANKVLELNERGILNSPVRVQNTGTAGSSRDFLNQAGGGPALSLEVHKSKTCWQMSNNKALQTGGVQSDISQPATVIWVGIPFFVDNDNFRVVWTNNDGSPDSSVKTFATTLFADGQAISGPPISTDASEWIIVYRLNGANSSVRCIKNGGSDTTVSGTIGGSGVSPFQLGWDVALTSERFFPAQVFEFDWFTGTLSLQETESKVNAMKQKWFVGVDGS